MGAQSSWMTPWLEPSLSLCETSKLVTRVSTSVRVSEVKRLMFSRRSWWRCWQVSTAAGRTLGRSLGQTSFLCDCSWET
ncbi:hypothetical protein LEMLEM_LOCUS13319 [Lemmus lemmus]